MQTPYELYVNERTKNRKNISKWMDTISYPTLKRSIRTTINIIETDVLFAQ